MDVVELVFPDDEAAKESDVDAKKRAASLKMLEMAQKWKKAKEQGADIE